MQWGKWTVIFVITWLGYVGSVCAANLEFTRVVVTLSDEHVLLDAELEYEFSDAISSALDNGVQLIFETKIELREDDAWIWSDDVIEHRLRTSLRFKPLSQLYEVSDLDTKQKRAFATLHSAMQAVGALQQMSIIERAKLDPKQEYQVTLEIALDVEALPLPLRPEAYVSTEWSFSSDSWQWSFKP